MRVAHSRIAALLSGLLSVSLLAAAWHAAGWASAADPTYPVTNYFVGSIDLVFTAAFVITSLLLGVLWRQAGSVALGMTAPLPIAAVYECAVDSTNHNLIPFEIAFLWVPAFLMALGPAVLGQRIRGAPRVPRGLKADRRAGA